jgi:hypothetical protein
MWMGLKGRHRCCMGANVFMVRQAESASDAALLLLQRAVSGNSSIVVHHAYVVLHAFSKCH